MRLWENGDRNVTAIKERLRKRNRKEKIIYPVNLKRHKGTNIILYKYI